MIIFHADGTVVFGHDAAGDGQAQARAAVLGREMRQEEHVLILRGNSVAAVGDDDFDGFAIAVEARAQQQFLHRGAFHGFGGVVDQIDDHAAQQFAIGADRGQIRRQVRADQDAFEAALEHGQGFGDDLVGGRGRKFRGGESRELGKFSDQRFQRGDFALDQAGAFADQAHQVGRIVLRGIGAVALEVARQSLRGKLDRRQRILDFVRDALRDFLPGRGLLRAQQVGQIVHDHHVAAVGAARAERTDRHGRVQQASGGRKFEFLRGGAQAQRPAHQNVNGARAFLTQQLREGNGLLGAFAEHAHRGGIDAANRFGLIDGDHAGGNIFENGFHQRAAALEFLDGLLQVLGEDVDLAAAVAELLGHAVEG